MAQVAAVVWVRSLAQELLHARAGRCQKIFLKLHWNMAMPTHLLLVQRCFRSTMAEQSSNIKWYAKPKLREEFRQVD